MAERCAEVLPEGRVSAGIVRRKQQREHVNDSGDAGWANQHARTEREADREFSVAGKQRDGRCMRQDEVAQNRHHEGIGAAFVEKLIDPVLKAAVEGELTTEDFVFTEDQKEDADGDA